VIVRVAVWVTEPRFAEIVTDVLEPTDVVLTVKAPEVLPAAMVTVAGTVADDRLLARVMTNPPAGAAALIVTVPVEVLPPATDVGLSFTETRVGGLTVNVAASFVPFKLAVTVTDVAAETGTVLAVKVAVDFPAATVTLAGTVTAALPLANVMGKPPLGAAPLSVTVPVEEAPPVSEAGLKLTDIRVGGFNVRFALWATVPSLAVIVATFCEGTPAVLAVNVALD